MGSHGFFAKLQDNPITQALHLPGSHKYEDSLPVQVGPNQGPYTGVDATLAGANAGYRAGGPGSTVGAPNAPTVYGAAGQGHGAMGGFAGSLSKFIDPGNSANLFQPRSTANYGMQTPPAANAYGTQNPWVAAARGAAQQNPQWGNS